MSFYLNLPLDFQDGIFRVRSSSFSIPVVYAALQPPATLLQPFRLLNTHCDHDFGFLSQRYWRNSAISSSDNRSPSLAAIFESTCDSLRMPGIIVLTSLLLRMKRSA